ncbi:unnamed protein product [Heterosigma akashiwo]
MRASFILAFLVLALVGCANAFVVNKPGSVAGISPHSALSSVSLQARKQTALSMAAEAKEYWEGEWICADCGYIYDRDDCGGTYFEDQRKGFKCPQCAGPRRRFAKKVGDKVGTTLDGGDGQILLFSYGGLALTVLFGIWAINDFELPF